VFPIVRKEDSDYCYSTALWMPSLIPFEADYNDYGGGENVKGVALDFLMNGIKERLHEMDVGENEYHDIAVKKNAFGIDLFFEAAHERRLFVERYGQKKMEMSFTMVNKEFVDKFWNEYKFDIYVGQGKGSDPESAYEKGMTWAKLADLIPGFLDELYEENLDPELHYSPEELAEMSAQEIADAKRSLSIYRRISREGLRLDKNEGHLLNNYFRNYGYGHELDLIKFQDLVLSLYDADAKEQACEIAKLWLVGKSVNSLMEQTRRVWLPGQHEGSQSSEYDVYRYMNKATEEIIQAQLDYWGYDDEDE
jgi:hypothetical protein